MAPIDCALKRWSDPLSCGPLATGWYRSSVVAKANLAGCRRQDLLLLLANRRESQLTVLKPRLIGLWLGYSHSAGSHYVSFTV